ncbi:cytochrome P450 [Crucibulum laeve]|uniref:Cytochrome P450 n=1 Tax=Crucibulum laeve TaxID=68775 RepID=A0A5C3LXA9_9AGAR|nr:cytochrome P450 [Crucibulum laeve]
MDSSFVFVELALAVVLLITSYCIYRSLTASHPHYPPGPRPHPFIGNVFQMPTESPEKVFAQWGAEYGDVVHVNVLGQPMIILNSLRSVRDLLDKRGSIYSDRPRFVLLSELMGWKHASTHTRYGPRFRKHRRFFNSIFNQRDVVNLRPLQDKETLTLLRGMIEEPDHFMDHFRRYAAATILKITYGYDINSADDLFVRLAERAGTLTVASGSPAATLVDFFPSMRHIPTWAPFASFKRDALEVCKAVDEMMDIPFERVKADLKLGNAVPSYTSTLLGLHNLDGSISPEDEEDIKGSAGTLFVAAEDTTTAVLKSFMLAMVLHPEVFREVQNEMDTVVGNQRLPVIDDRSSLPYLDCVLKEVVRWNPPVPLGIPHRLMEDDTYRDYLLPGGSTVIANIYAILQDFTEPDSFRPERFLDNPDLLDPRDVIFGFGRRLCPGRHFADSSIWSISANIVATMDIGKAIDEKGNEVTPPAEYTSGFVRHPKEFKCSIKPRSDKAVLDLIFSKQSSINGIRN